MSTTLICWCRNDSEVSDAARRYPANFRYSGCRRAALVQTLGRLQGDDILIITAHGEPTAFGEADGTFSDFSVREFADELLAYPAATWRGLVYLDICHGYEFGLNLRPLIHERLPNLRVFGCEGDTKMDIDLTAHREVTG